MIFLILIFGNSGVFAGIQCDEIGIERFNDGLSALQDPGHWAFFSAHGALPILGNSTTENPWKNFPSVHYLILRPAVRREPDACLVKELVWPGSAGEVNVTFLLAGSEEVEGVLSQASYDYLQVSVRPVLQNDWTEVVKLQATRRQPPLPYSVALGSDGLTDLPAWAKVEVRLCAIVTSGKSDEWFLVGDLSIDYDQCLVETPAPTLSPTIPAPQPLPDPSGASTGQPTPYYMASESGNSPTSLPITADPTDLIIAGSSVLVCLCLVLVLCWVMGKRSSKESLSAQPSTVPVAESRARPVPTISPPPRTPGRGSNRSRSGSTPGRRPVPSISIPSIMTSAPAPSSGRAQRTPRTPRAGRSNRSRSGSRSSARSRSNSRRQRAGGGVTVTEFLHGIQSDAWSCTQCGAANQSYQSVCFRCQTIHSSSRSGGSSKNRSQPTAMMGTVDHHTLSWNTQAAPRERPPLNQQPASHESGVFLPPPPPRAARGPHDTFRNSHDFLPPPPPPASSSPTYGSVPPASGSVHLQRANTGHATNTGEGAVHAPNARGGPAYASKPPPGPMRTNAEARSSYGYIPVSRPSSTTAHYDSPSSPLNGSSDGHGLGRRPAPSSHYESMIQPLEF